MTHAILAAAGAAFLLFAGSVAAAQAPVFTPEQGSAWKTEIIPR